jgi:hypothetical protein
MRRNCESAEHVIALIPGTDVHDVSVYSSAFLSSTSDIPAQSVISHNEPMCSMSHITHPFELSNLLYAFDLRFVGVVV